MNLHIIVLVEHDDSSKVATQQSILYFIIYIFTQQSETLRDMVSSAETTLTVLRGSGKKL